MVKGLIICWVQWWIGNRLFDYGFAPRVDVGPTNLYEKCYTNVLCLLVCWWLHLEGWLNTSILVVVTGIILLNTIINQKKKTALWINIKICCSPSVQYLQEYFFI